MPVLSSVPKAFIENSFRRCERYGLDPDQRFSRLILEGQRLADRLHRNRTLIEIATPFISQLCDFLEGTSFFAILTDRDGCILTVLGDEDIVRDATDLKMIPGAFMDERNIGTNAMGTCLAEGVPLQVSGSEHFITAYHRWTCSGSPIRDTDGTVLGALDVTGNCLDVHQHTLGMVAAAVNAIERTLELHSTNAFLRRNSLFTEKLMNSIQAGILSCGLDGTVLTVNSEAARLLGIDKAALPGMNFASLLPSWNDILHDLRDAEEFQNRDVLINARTNKLYFNLSAYQVVGEDRVAEAIILIVKDIKRVRKHANDLLGNRAIYTFDKMVGRSPAFLEALAFAQKVADSNSTVLISGESGTGKEIFAQSIHNDSRRRDEPFVSLNCGAIPRALIESELFGYSDGAFTGAKKGGQAGKFEFADGGTLFLDEIGEMPLDMQVKLLRVIEGGTVNRLGASGNIPVNVRIIAATNKDLRTEVARGRFRMDLFYRLNVLPLSLPPLRERTADIPLLVDYYSAKISHKTNRRRVVVTDEQMELLCRHQWPGNIRELENLIELIISTEKFPSDFLAGRLEPPAAPREVSQETASLEGMEKRHISRVLTDFHFNISAAAKHLEMGRNTLYRKIKLYNIPCPNPVSVP